ncbi:MAG: Fe-S cluster assembly ATPase SufC, partial [Bacilli bacterium]
DEIDSGLDIDALKVVANSINLYYEKFSPSILIITHHNKLLDLIKPNYVHIMKDGKIVKSGDIHLAEKLEDEGFEAFNISGLGSNE